MASPKPESPEKFWLDVKATLQSRVDTESAEYSAYHRLLYNNQQELIDTAAFCSLDQPEPLPLSQSDFLDGSWREKMRAFALNYLYWLYCQDDD